MATRPKTTRQTRFLKRALFLEPIGPSLKTCSSVYYLVAAARPNQALLVAGPSAG